MRSPFFAKTYEKTKESTMKYMNNEPERYIERTIVNAL